MVEVNCSVYQKQGVGEALEGGLAVQCAEGEWRDQTFEEQGLSGPLEGMVVVVLWVA